jgi:hypothetical protein
MASCLDCTDDFEAKAKAYRRRRILQFVPLGAVVLLVCGASRFNIHSGLGMAAIGCAAVVGLLAYFSIEDVELVCPACKEDPDEYNGQFCPNCGSSNIANWKGNPIYMFGIAGDAQVCGTCGKKVFVTWKGIRSYKICYCRKCGAHLDKRGV